MSCNHANAPAHTFCVVCGAMLDRRRCSRCGVANDPKYLFCYACGQSLRNHVADEQAPAPVLSFTYDLDALRIGLSEIKPAAEESSIRLTQSDIMNLVKAKQRGNL